jgi:hypothetical protein
LFFHGVFQPPAINEPLITMKPIRNHPTLLMHQWSDLRPGRDLRQIANIADKYSSAAGCDCVGTTWIGLEKKECLG